MAFYVQLNPEELQRGQNSIQMCIPEAPQPAFNHTRKYKTRTSDKHLHVFQPLIAFQEHSMVRTIRAFTVIRIHI